MLIAYGGEWERGVEITRGAMALNPHHPGWYHFTLFWDHFRKHEYEEALETTKRINMPEVFWTYVVTAAVCGRLGRREEARAALDALRNLFPDYRQNLRANLELWILDADFVEQVMQGLAEAEALAGSEIATIRRQQEAQRSDSSSGFARPAVADSGSMQAGAQSFWITVLPFRGQSGDATLEALGDGLTEDITTGLSRFPYLSVISRQSTLRYKERTGDVRAMCEELGARYVLEGSIRKVGKTARVSVQLLDATTGTHLWAETYDRNLEAADILAAQDEISDRVVATVADSYGILVRSLIANLQGRADAELNTSEWMLRYFDYMQHITPHRQAALRDGLERALEQDAGQANVWACLCTLYVHEYCFGFNPRPEALDRALAAARRAVEADRTSQLGYQVLAQSHFFRRELAPFRAAAERAMELNPRDSNTVAVMGLMIEHTGEFE
ncbi:MAG: hypothetical protein ACRD24_12530, partial [Terriglobales bacterium]